MRVRNEARLEKLLDYILAEQVRCGKSPTYRKIMKECGYTSIGTVAADVAILKDRGLLEAGSGGWEPIRMPENLAPGKSHITPLVGSVHCGPLTEAIEDIQMTVALPDEIFGKGDHFLLRAEGESMIDRGIFAGDLLVVRRQDTACLGETVLAMTAEGEATCKIYAQKGGKPYLKAANEKATKEDGSPYYDIYPEGEWQILGVVDFVIHAL